MRYAFKQPIEIPHAANGSAALIDKNGKLAINNDLLPKGKNPNALSSGGRASVQPVGGGLEGIEGPMFDMRVAGGERGELQEDKKSITIEDALQTKGLPTKNLLQQNGQLRNRAKVFSKLSNDDENIVHANSQQEAAIAVLG